MPVTYDTRDGVALITFDDGKANAYTPEALAELSAALDRTADEQGIGAVVLAGRPGRFSAGFDLALMTGGGETMRSLVGDGARFMSKVLVHPLPVVAACTGHALAAGALVLLAADHRVGAAGDFKVGLNEVAIGMPLPRFGVDLARYRMPPTRFDRIILGEVSGPEAAIAAGFLDELTEPERVVDAALEIGGRLSGLQRRAVATTKAHARAELRRLMLKGLDADLADLTPPRTT